MVLRPLQSYTLLGSCMLLSSCAGPATPLGSVWVTRVDDLKRDVGRWLASGDARPEASVHFHPARQVLHGATPLVIVVDDPNGVAADPKLAIRYNDLDVTPAFLRQAELKRGNNGKRLSVRVPVIRLSAVTNHRIEVDYVNASGKRSTAFYRSPTCDATRMEQVQSTSDFNPDPKLVETIDRVSRSIGFNPSLTAALVAQESSFNPKTVSWAKAIGLTQVTSLAETEVSSVYARWPRYPGISEMSVPLVKMLIYAGQINDRNEWRLDAARSVRGGLQFAKMLAERWSSAENDARIRALFDDPERVRLELVLASYNSGYSRVFNALVQFGPDWKTSPELKEARKYVNRIFSYCDHFSEDGGDHEIET